jgi:arylsulfatase A
MAKDGMRVMRAAILGLIALCGAGGAQIAGAQNSDAAKGRPNIVLFLADDLGWGDLACYGHPRIKSPNLDAFAKQGVRLTQCYAASGVCSPSRSAILTGRTPHRNGVFTWIAAGSEVHLRTSEVALPKLLKDAGYATAHVGKWHLNGKFNSPEQPQPGDHGYEWWLATQNNAEPSHKNPVNFVRNGTALGAQEGYSAHLVVDEGIRWLKQHRDRSKPFMLSVWAHEPHQLIESDPKYQELYGDLQDPNLRQHHGNISQLDDAFGRLMRELDEQGLTGSTFVFFTSDNGPAGDGMRGRPRGSTGGLRGRKAQMYEGGIRVPGIARWPGTIRPGTTSDLPVIGTDLFPTLVRLGGAKLPTDRKLDGVDILGVLDGKADTVVRPVPLYWRLGMAPIGPKIAMRKGDWKILSSPDLIQMELYNLQTDPQETTDLRERNPVQFDAMRKDLITLNAEIEAEGPDWWKRLAPGGALPPK